MWNSLPEDVVILLKKQHQKLSFITASILFIKTTVQQEPLYLPNHSARQNIIFIFIHHKVAIKEKYYLQNVQSSVIVRVPYAVNFVFYVHKV